MRFNPLHNILLKVSAVALALLLWVHVATNKTYDYQLDLPLKLINIPKGLVLTSEVPHFATVKVKATGKQLLALSTREPVLRLDMFEAHVGTIDRTITNSEVLSAFDRSYEVAEIITPRTLVLKFEKEGEKKVSIRSNVIAEAAPGYALTAPPLVTPDTITVTGPAPSVGKLKALETTQSQFVGLTNTVSERIRLVLPESLFLSVRDSLVTVKIEVSPQP